MPRPALGHPLPGRGIRSEGSIPLCPKPHEGPSMTEKRRALIVANCEYEDPALRPLTAPAQDAEELARVLNDKNIGGFDVKTLLNQRATEVSRTIEEFFVFSDSGPEDLLLFYFSGHGVT